MLSEHARSIHVRVRQSCPALQSYDRVCGSCGTHRLAFSFTSCPKRASQPVHVFSAIFGAYLMRCSKCSCASSALPVRLLATTAPPPVHIAVSSSMLTQRDASAGASLALPASRSAVAACWRPGMPQPRSAVLLQQHLLSSLMAVTCVFIYLSGVHLTMPCCCSRCVVSPAEHMRHHQHDVRRLRRRSLWWLGSFAHAPDRSAARTQHCALHAHSMSRAHHISARALCVAIASQRGATAQHRTAQQCMSFSSLRPLQHMAMLSARL